MAKDKLTDLSIRQKAKPKDKEFLLADGKGLFLRIRPSNAKDWLFVYTFAGKQRKLGLGSFPSISLEAARRQAESIRETVKSGIDPQLQRKAKEAEQVAQRREMEKQQTRITVNDLFDRWESVDLVRRKDGGKEIRRMFEKDVLPAIGKMAVEDVRKGHITGVTDGLLARGVTRMAKMIFSLMRQMFRFAVDRDIIEFDPTAAIRKAKIGGKDTERDRVLGEDEIKALWQQLPDAGLSSAAMSAVWIALSTCCRIGELMATRWEHIDFEARTWWIPAEHSKNGKAHKIALSDFALKNFQKLKDTADESLAKLREKEPNLQLWPWVHPNRNKSGPVCPKTVTKQLGDRQRPGLPPMKGRAKAELSATLVLSGGKWGPHDLRRTGATMMVKLGVLPEVAERCLNHTEQNRVKRIYQRHSYEQEMADAWHKLGERLDLLIRSDEKKVVAVSFGEAA